ncbi:uncharacterized protein LOC135204993 [Macrobrachium nipponense]|uniref:uncharacterized protein LOC135204993 n=1 Tax=Macrobrachium nipponense TaxID=159736 RepID=UPI0030C7C655
MFPTQEMSRNSKEYLQSKDLSRLKRLYFENLKRRSRPKRSPNSKRRFFDLQKKGLQLFPQKMVLELKRCSDLKRFPDTQKMLDSKRCIDNKKGPGLGGNSKVSRIKRCLPNSKRWSRKLKRCLPWIPTDVSENSKRWSRLKKNVLQLKNCLDSKPRGFDLKNEVCDSKRNVRSKDCPSTIKRCSGLKRGSRNSKDCLDSKKDLSRKTQKEFCLDSKGC